MLGKRALGPPVPRKHPSPRTFCGGRASGSGRLATGLGDGGRWGEVTGGSQEVHGGSGVCGYGGVARTTGATSSAAVSGG